MEWLISTPRSLRFSRDLMSAFHRFMRIVPPGPRRDAPWICELQNQSHGEKAALRKRTVENFTGTVLPARVLGDRVTFEPRPRPRYFRSLFGTSGSGRRTVLRPPYEKDVVFLNAAPNPNDEIDAMYRTKYHRHGATYVNMMPKHEPSRSSCAHAWVDTELKGITVQKRKYGKRNLESILGLGCAA